VVNMQLERYRYEVNPSFLQYDFYSEGPRGKIRKMVSYTFLGRLENHFPGCMIIVEGSTRSRTRLYQMGIAKNYAEIDQIFDIQGLTRMGNWVPFKGGENYLALLIARK
jgi:hypothetical protein